MANPIAFTFFSIGFAAIISSFFVGMHIVYPKSYNFGPEVPKLTRQWMDRKEKDYTKNIFGKIWKAYKEDRDIVENKAKFVKSTLILFSTGLVFIILSKIAIMVTYFVR
jgi:hypothetical protein